MTKKKKRKRMKLLTGCFRCGAPWRKQSGFVMCTKCGCIREQTIIAPQPRGADGRVYPQMIDEQPAPISIDVPGKRRALDFSAPGKPSKQTAKWGV